MSKYKFWIVLSVVVAFAAGLLGGILSERYYFHRKWHERIAREQRPPARFPSLEQMAQELGLSAEQQEQIKKIFERNDAKLKELRTSMHGRLEAIRGELKTELDAVLTAEQRKKFESMIEDYLLKRKQEYERRRDRDRSDRSPEKPEGDKR